MILLTKGQMLKEAEMDSEASGTDYEVFLSFRGPDTRQGFADVLYDYMDRAGIRVFRDDDELAIGDKIETILRAIDSSLICVPVFSKTFASSKWCLTEVRRMVELKKDVVPIFYDVTPDDVDLKTPAYREFMAKHESTLGKDKVDEWVDALKTITKLKGREVLTTSYTKFCKMFVEELLIKLKPRKRYPLDNLIGMDAQLEYAVKLLDTDAGGVKYILIHGMGGIGKTTLAKVIFNKLSTSFDSCCFLENLRESLKRDGLDYLQKQLAASLDPKSATTSNLSRNAGERFRKKVLIILDEVDTGVQIEKLVDKSWFASGSRIIITSRNVNVLNECERLDEDCVQSLEMSTLKDDEALQLFTLCAFQQDSPPALFEELSKEASSITGGLPLALKVIASRLRGKNETIWRHVLTRSRNQVPKEVKKRLKMSYDALDSDQKQIFLDIACFFIGTEKSNACYMWEACDLDPTYGLEVLVSMSLVKITDNNVLWMHDQLRDLGRDIVREESINNPMKRSRIWLREDALKVLMGKEGKQAVEALSIRKPPVNTLTDEHFSSFHNLRFLELAGATFVGNFKDFLESLMWLSWHLCPTNFNLSNSCLENLVILDLSHSLIDENWGGWSQIQMAKNLKVLELRSCHNLTRTPDFTEVHTIERLILSQCNQLATIGSSIANLTSLKFLDLRDCYSLRGLPEELGLLGDLEDIFVSGDYEPLTFSMPKSIGNLKSLVSLKLDALEIDSIPDSISGLKKLKHLSVSFCRGMKELPATLGDLGSLVELDLSCVGASELPDSIGRLVKLKELSLHGCDHIKELPGSIWNLTSLVRLDLSDTPMSNLPDSIRDLQELQVLILSRCKIRTFPASIGRLKKLVELNADYCDFLEEIPLEIGELCNLRRLSLSGSCIQMLPSTITQLTLLQELHLEGCHQLQELPELPPGILHRTCPLRKLGHDGSKSLVYQEEPKSLCPNSTASQLTEFTYQEIKKITKNFTHAISAAHHKIFSGFISKEVRVSPEAHQAAVKIYKGHRHHQDNDGWLAQVNLFKKLSHPNLVQLIGHCNEAEHRTLVYEYMTRGSLADNLFSKEQSPLLWDIRVKIAVDAARGLTYLHENERPVIHRNVKPSKILLDMAYNAKIFGFGVAIAGSEDCECEISDFVVGTAGYVAPEYSRTGRVSTKSDVYSFGVVLIELLSGRRWTDLLLEEPDGLVEWTRRFLEEGKSLCKLVDARLKEDYPIKEAKRVVKLARKCFNENPQQRPHMREILDSLNSLQETDVTEQTLPAFRGTSTSETENGRSPKGKHVEGAGTESGISDGKPVEGEAEQSKVSNGKSAGGDTKQSRSSKGKFVERIRRSLLKLGRGGKSWKRLQSQP